MVWSHHRQRIYSRREYPSVHSIPSVYFVPWPPFSKVLRITRAPLPAAYVPRCCGCCYTGKVLRITSTHRRRRSIEILLSEPRARGEMIAGWPKSVLRITVAAYAAHAPSSAVCPLLKCMCCARWARLSTPSERTTSPTRTGGSGERVWNEASGVLCASRSALARSLAGVLCASRRIALLLPYGTTGTPSKAETTWSAADGHR